MVNTFTSANYAVISIRVGLYVLELRLTTANDADSTESLLDRLVRYTPFGDRIIKESVTRVSLQLEPRTCIEFNN